MEFATLQALCAAKGTNPTALVRKLGMSTGNLKNWRSGINPSVEVAKKICATLGCTMDELFDAKKPAAREQPVSAAIKHLLNEVQDLSVAEAIKVLDYVQLLKLKRKSAP